MTSTRRSRTALLAGIGLAAIAPACAAEPAAPTPAGPQAAPAAPLEANSASTAWVSPRPASTVAVLTLPARVVPDARSQAVLSVPSLARVVGVRANVGELLEDGAPVADVVLPELAEAGGRLEAARTRKAAYQRVLEQLDELGKHGLARLSDRTDAEVKLAEATADEQLALAILNTAGVSAKEAARLVSSGGRTTLRSPIAGRLAESRAVVGALLAPDDGPLARVAAIASARIEARVPVEAGAFLRGTFRAASGEAREAKQAGCLPEVEAEDGTVRCWFNLEGEPLPSQLPGQLTLAAPEGVRLLAVPHAAVGLDEKGAFVFRRGKEGGQERVEVRVFGSVGGDALVEGALEEDDRIAARAPSTAGGAE